MITVVFISWRIPSMRCQSVVVVLLASLLVCPLLFGAESPAERGKKAMLTGSYTPPTMALGNYELAWKHWGLKEKPAAADYDRLFRERYGLHPAPYPNDNLPMGLRVADN